MIKICVPLIVLSLSVTACATGYKPRQCPMGQMTEISVDSDESPENFALETAARSTLNAGYEKFTIIKGNQVDYNSYVILIKMVPYTVVTDPPNTVTARDLLIARGFPVPETQKTL